MENLFSSLSVSIPNQQNFRKLFDSRAQPNFLKPDFIAQAPAPEPLRPSFRTVCMIESACAMIVRAAVLAGHRFAARECQLARLALVRDGWTCSPSVPRVSVRAATAPTSASAPATAKAMLKLPVAATT